MKPIYDAVGFHCPDGTPCDSKQCCDADICQRGAEQAARDANPHIHGSFPLKRICEGHENV